MAVMLQIFQSVLDNVEDTKDTRKYFSVTKKKAKISH